MQSSGFSNYLFGKFTYSRDKNLSPRKGFKRPELACDLCDQNEDEKSVTFTIEKLLLKEFSR